MAKDDCKTCGGTGKVSGARYTDPEQDCPDCGGTGKVSGKKESVEADG